MKIRSFIFYCTLKNGNPHYYRVPRVVLITPNFVLATAKDVADAPTGYALGNIIFSEYERDEEECQISLEDRANGQECEPAVLIVPIADVMIHSEYKLAGDMNSVALIKLLKNMKSKYMLPVCLPLRKYVLPKNYKQRKEKVYYVDFGSDAPREFMSEEKIVDTIRFVPNKMCKLNRSCYSTNDTSCMMKRFICSDGCGFHSGAPSVFHEGTGHWTIIAIAVGNYYCPDPLISQSTPSSARHLLIHPYMSWIISTISGTTALAMAKDDPFGFVKRRLFDGKKYDPQKSGWIGRWWMGGIRCYDRGSAADELFRFYHEVFQVNPKQETNMRYYLELETNSQIAIVCVKVGMPYNLGRPRVWDLETSSIKLRIPVIKFTYKYKIQVEAWGTNKSLMVDHEDILEYDPN